jgi:adenylylsulfate kinase
MKKQKGSVFWLYGLSGAGKTTISRLLKNMLDEQGLTAIILDGDEMRAGLNRDLGFSPGDRLENVRRVAEIAKILAAGNLLVICALITPMAEYRTLVRSIIKDNFYQIFIDCPVAVCEQRDIKGLYKLSRQQKIKDFTGVDSSFETGDYADLVLHTHRITANRAAKLLYDFVTDTFTKHLG